MSRYAPMLAKLCKVPFDSGGYLYEPKYDGIRCIAYNGTLINRNQVDVTERFPEVSLHTGYVLDGELVCLDAREVPSFQLIQTRMNRLYDVAQKSQTCPAKFVAFDVLEEPDGSSLVNASLAQRKTILADVFQRNPRQFSIAPYVLDEGVKYAENLTALGWEGVMAKRITSLYRPGARTIDWLKFKLRKTAIAEIYGITPGLGHRSDTFGAMIIGIDGIHLGDVGTGFTDAEAEEMLEIFQEAKVNVPTIPDYKGPVAMWMAPVLECKVTYIELTNDGKLRHPAFEGLLNV